jgi:hypothetical protein
LGQGGQTDDLNGSCGKSARSICESWEKWEKLLTRQLDGRWQTNQGDIVVQGAGSVVRMQDVLRSRDGNLRLAAEH